MIFGSYKLPQRLEMRFTNAMSARGEAPGNQDRCDEASGEVCREGREEESRQEGWQEISAAGTLPSRVL